MSVLSDEEFKAQVEKERNGDGQPVKKEIPKHLVILQVTFDPDNNAISIVTVQNAKSPFMMVSLLREAVKQLENRDVIDRTAVAVIKVLEEKINAETKIHRN